MSTNALMRLDGSTCPHPSMNIAGLTSLSTGRISLLAWSASTRLIPVHIQDLGHNRMEIPVVATRLMTTIQSCTMGGSSTMATQANENEFERRAKFGVEMQGF